MVTTGKTELSMSAPVSLVFAADSNFLSWKLSVDRALNALRFRISELERNNSKRLSLVENKSSDKDSICRCRKLSTDWTNTQDSNQKSDSSGSSDLGYGSVVLISNDSATIETDIPTENISSKADYHERLVNDETQLVDIIGSSKTSVKSRGGPSTAFEKEMSNCLHRATELGSTKGETCAPSTIYNRRGNGRNSRDHRHCISVNGEVCDDESNITITEPEGCRKNLQPLLECTNDVGSRAMLRKLVSPKNQPVLSKNLKSTRKRYRYTNRNRNSRRAKCKSTKNEVSIAAKTYDPPRVKNKSSRKMANSDLTSDKDDERRKSIRSLLRLTLSPEYTHESPSETNISKRSKFTKSKSHPCFKQIGSTKDFL